MREAMKMFLTGLAGLMLGAGAFGQVPNDERSALIALYEATGGEQWRADSGWLGPEGTECEWFGVDCFEGRIFNLTLAGNGLVGSLPPEILDLELPDSGRVDLSRNALGGNLDAVFEWAATGFELVLDGNRYSGTIPGTFFNVRVSLADNRLTDYGAVAGHAPPETSRIVDLSGNRLGSLPPDEWFSGNRLFALWLSDNLIAGDVAFPDTSMPELAWIELDSNQIERVSGLDAGNMPNLGIVDLSDNPLTEWPQLAGSFDRLESVSVRDASLDAPLPSSIANPGENPQAFYVLDIAGNQLSGSDLVAAFESPSLGLLDASRNPLGELPATLDSPAGSLSWLRLSDSALAGAAPAWFESLTLFELDLSGNSLGGNGNSYLAAIPQGSGSIRVDFSDAGLSGSLPERLLTVGLTPDRSNFCWNDFTEPFDASLEEAANTAQIGGNLDSCNAQERANAISPEISGSWFAPEQPGHGYSLMMTDGGPVVGYWFGFRFEATPNLPEVALGAQVWATQVAMPRGATVEFDRLTGVAGRFGEGMAGPGIVDLGSTARMTALTDGRLHVFSSWGQTGLCGGDFTANCFEAFDRDRRNHVQLTRLAGTRCDNRHPRQGWSGIWFDPARSGEGFVIEVLPNGSANVYWLTHTPGEALHQAWLVGTGQFEDDSLIVPDMIRPSGGGNYDDYDPATVEYENWGSLSFEFTSPDAGEVAWISNDPAYGSGSYSIERLARPMLAECD